MWRFCLLLAGCSFTAGMLPADAPGTGEQDVGNACAPRWPIETNAPPGFTISVDITEALAVAPAAELHVLADATEIDRVIAGTLLDVKVPPAGALSLVASSGAVLADPANVYLFAESFDALPIGDRVAARFAALPSTDWAVADDGGNRVFHVAGGGRHPAAIVGLTLADGDIRARIRVGPGGTQQHNGLAARGNSMATTTLDGFVGQLLGDVNRTRIAEYTNGMTPVELVGDARAVTRGVWYTLRLRYVGDTVELYIDGTRALVTVHADWDGQLVGLQAHDTDVDFDDVTVRMAVEPSPIAMLGPRVQCP